MTNSVANEEMEVMLDRELADLSAGLKLADAYVNPLVTLAAAVVVLALLVWWIRP